MSQGSKPDAAPNVREVVARLGRIVKDRVREFATEADEHFRETLGEARDELDEELGGKRQRVEPEDGAEPASGDETPTEGK